MAAHALSRLVPLAMVAATCLAGVVGVGCAGTLSDPELFDVDGGASVSASASDAGGVGCPDVPTEVFATSCATSGCHSATDRVQGLDLGSPGVASRVVGVCGTGGGVLANPSDPQHSELYEKITPMPPFGSRMPLAKPPLDDATIQCVLAWIAAQSPTGMTSCGGAGNAAGGADAGAGSSRAGAPDASE